MANSLPQPSFNPPGLDQQTHAARLYLTQLDDYFTTYNSTDAQKFNTLKSSIKGTAASWFETMCEEESCQTYQGARRAFELKYIRTPARMYRAKIRDDCKQRSNESTADFATRCRYVATQVISHFMDDWVGDITRDVPMPETASAAAKAEFPNGIPVTLTLSAREKTRITVRMRKEAAIDMFLAGCHQHMREVLLVKEAVHTWEQLQTAAQDIELHTQPSTVPKVNAQLLQPKREPVTYIAQPVQPMQPHTMPQQPRQGQQPTNIGAIAGHKYKGKSSGGRPKPPSPKAQPHPQQQRTHEQDITCYYCGGIGHTTRGCLAKAQRLAQQPTSAVIPNHPQPVQQQYLQQPLPVQAGQFQPECPVMGHTTQQAPQQDFCIRE